MPDKLDLSYLPNTPQTRALMVHARHTIERISFGDDQLVEWRDEIVNATKRVQLNKPGGYTDVDMLIKSAMLKV